MLSMRLRQRPSPKDDSNEDDCEKQFLHVSDARNKEDEAGVATKQEQFHTSMRGEKKRPTCSKIIDVMLKWWLFVGTAVAKKNKKGGVDALLLRYLTKDSKQTIAGIWVLYFLTKISLHAYHHALYISSFRNIAFLIWLLLVESPARCDGELPKNAVLKAKLVRAFNLILAVLVLWGDSWAPPLSETIAVATNPTMKVGPSCIMNLLLGFAQDVAPILAAIFCVVIAVRCLARSQILVSYTQPWWMTRLVLALLAFVGLINADALLRQIPTWRIQSYYNTFYETEAARRVELPDAQALLEKPPVDVVILHVCSLGWDDIEVVDMMNDPLFKKFGFWFQNFNTVSGTSLPAAIRLLRSCCGQQKTSSLEQPAPSGREQCYLMDALKRLDYEVYSAFDHDGQFGAFKQGVMDFGHAAEPPSIDGLPIEQIMFDQSKNVSPDAVFDLWLKQRQLDGAARAALYFNTVHLHAGSMENAEEKELQSRTSRALTEAEKFKVRLKRLFRFFDEVLSKLEASGRNTVVLVVPEHGGALRATTIQTTYHRHIPLPRVTKAPLGVAFVGPAFANTTLQSTVYSDRFVSLMVVSEIISHAIESPEEKLNVDQLSETNHVAENGYYPIVYFEGEYILMDPWMKIDSVDLPMHTKDRQRLEPVVVNEEKARSANSSLRLR